MGFGVIVWEDEEEDFCRWPPIIVLSCNNPAFDAQTKKKHGTNLNIFKRDHRIWTGKHVCREYILLHFVESPPPVSSPLAINIASIQSSHEDRRRKTQRFRRSIRVITGGRGAWATYNASPHTSQKKNKTRK